MTSCSSCGMEIGQDARFCPNCGASQTLSGEERRIVTVLFADIAGYTALAEERDPEEVKHLVDRAFERLARDITTFGGVIDKVVGDGIIALFGAPVAHEDDAERAVRAGLRMQQTMTTLSKELDPPIAVRIGINTGEVLVGGTAAGGDYTAMGDVVNSADRLQKLAEPGQTLVGAPTKQAVDDAITFDFVGDLPARGRERPLAAWLAVAPVRPPGQHRQRSGAFVGRRHEMDLLGAQAELAVGGRRAQLAVVVGEAGIGKTRLANEAAAAIGETAGARVLEGRCLPYGEANVWWPVAELVRDLYELQLDAPMTDAEVVLRKALWERLDDPSNDRVDRLTTALLHTLGYDTALRGGDRSRNRSEVTLAVTMAIEAELRLRPIVLLLSDMHWAASAVWGLCRNVLSDLARERLVVIMTTRSEDPEHLWQGRHGLTVVQLGPLDGSASASLLADLGAELGEGQVEDLVSRSGGNPFFLEELAGLVSTQGSQPDSDFDVEIDELPATLRGLISARLDALDSNERALLEDAAVLGRTGSLDGLFTLVAETRDMQGMHTALTGLVDADLLEIDARRFRFRSNLIRDVAYGRQTKTVRARKHFGIANYLENAQGDTIRNSVVVAIAEHYRAAAQLSDELAALAGLDQRMVVDRAAYWLLQAGERALEVGEPIQAGRWYGAGMALSADDEDNLARFLYGRAKARTEVHDVAGARADLDRLEGLTDVDPRLGALALLVRGDVDRKAGDLSLAVTRLKEAAARLEGMEDATEQALALRLLGMTEMARRDEAAARAALEASRNVAVAAGDRRAEGWALQSLAWHAFRSGRLDAARGLVDDAIAIFSEIEDYGALVWAQGVLAWVSFHTGDWDRAQELIERVLPETSRRGDPQAQSLMQNLDATLQLFSGRAARAAERAREAATLAEAVDDITVAVTSKAVEGRALVSLGLIEEGTSALEAAYATADQADDSESRRIAVVANCASAARLGESDRAIRWAARYVAAPGQPEVVGESDLLVSLALAMLQRGAVDEAAAQLDEEDLGSTSYYAQAVESLVAVAQVELDRSVDLAHRVLEGRATYLDRVLAHLALAAVARRRRDDRAVVEALRHARSELESTDDQVSQRLLDLAESVFGHGSRSAAEAQMYRLGLDPTGWGTALTLAVRRHEAPDSPAPSP
ncbi:MAG: adenylate/guanylate cyclase domain-containing protein [Actinomycetota bacterium]